MYENLYDVKVQKVGVIVSEKQAWLYTSRIQMYLIGLYSCEIFIYSPVETGCRCIENYQNEHFIRDVTIKS